jgi:multisubunit Na+/H+ antiporter MnhB subunit
MRRSLILDVTTRMITGSTLVLSVYLLAAGHNQPGGGFIGGLVAGSAISIAYVGGGLKQVRAFTRVRPWTILGGGLMIASSAAAIPLFLGGDVLEQGFVSLRFPVLGDIKLTSALFFDTGVFAVVAGTVAMAFEALGEEHRAGQQSPDDSTPTAS